jgi:peptidoglycan/LPS O-acetylase OafA/YrhL
LIARPIRLTSRDDHGPANTLSISPSTPSSPGGGRFLVLDACRGILALLVVLFHTDEISHWRSWAVVRNGSVAVDFFFALSGFVIASAYGARLGTGLGLVRYAVRRFGRLYPLHLAALLAYCGVELVRLLAFDDTDAFNGNFSLHALGEHLLLVQAFSANNLSWNYPAWSISVELWVNLAFGLAVLALARSARWLRPVALLATTALLGFMLAKPALAPNPAWNDVFRGAFEFCLGIMVFAAHSRCAERDFRLPGVAEVLIVPIVVVAFGWPDACPLAVRAIGLALAVFILAFETGPISRLLLQRPFLLLGTISYSVYLTHSLYLELLNDALIGIGDMLHRSAVVTVHGEALVSIGGPWAMDAASLLALGATIVGSVLTYRYIEEPMRAMFNQLANRIAIPRIFPRRAPG